MWLAIGHWPLVICHWRFSHWPLTMGNWPLVIGHWQLAIGNWLLVIGPLGTVAAQVPISVCLSELRPASGQGHHGREEELDRPGDGIMKMVPALAGSMPLPYRFRIGSHRFRIGFALVQYWVDSLCSPAGNSQTATLRGETGRPSTVNRLPRRRHQRRLIKGLPLRLASSRTGTTRSTTSNASCITACASDSQRVSATSLTGPQRRNA